jgi:hypothetical protein
MSSYMGKRPGWLQSKSHCALMLFQLPPALGAGLCQRLLGVVVPSHRVGVPIRDRASTREQRSPIIHVVVIMWNVTDSLIASSIDFNLAAAQCFGSIVAEISNRAVDSWSFNYTFSRITVGVWSKTTPTRNSSIGKVSNIHTISRSNFSEHRVAAVNVEHSLSITAGEVLYPCLVSLAKAVQVIPLSTCLYQVVVTNTSDTCPG